MKKHIQKKFLFEMQSTQQIGDLLEEKGKMLNLKDVQDSKTFPKDSVGFVVTDTNKFIQTFPYKYQGKLRMIPECDPVLIYFHNAYCNYKAIEPKKKKILKIVLNGPLTESVINDLYSFYGITSGFVIFIFTALEAFIHRCIPEDFKYEKDCGKKLEIYTKHQIDPLPFDEKIKDVLKKATNMDFREKYPLKFQRIENLKEFRNSIVHTKAATDDPSPFGLLYKKGLEFKYEETIDAIMDFMNFYKPGYIEYCPCSNED